LGGLCCRHVGRRALHGGAHDNDAGGCRPAPHMLGTARARPLCPCARCGNYAVSILHARTARHARDGTRQALWRPVAALALRGRVVWVPGTREGRLCGWAGGVGCVRCTTPPAPRAARPQGLGVLLRGSGRGAASEAVAGRSSGVSRLFVLARSPALLVIRKGRQTHRCPARCALRCSAAHRRATAGDQHRRRGQEIRGQGEHAHLRPRGAPRSRVAHRRASRT
jgi:hypothetical protein